MFVRFMQCPVVMIAGRNKRTALSDPLTSAFIQAMVVNGLSSLHKSPTHATLGLLNVHLKASSNTGSFGKALLWERRMRRVMAQEGEKKMKEIHSTTLNATSIRSKMGILSLHGHTIGKSEINETGETAPALLDLFITQTRIRAREAPGINTPSRGLF